MSFFKDKIRKTISFFSPSQLAVIIFAIYFFIGSMIFQDYGISLDESVERHTSIVNYVYVMGYVLRGSEHESVRSIGYHTHPLYTLRDRHYGTFLQGITVAIEHLNNFEMTNRNIFLMRHYFTFINWFVGGVFLFLILKRRFPNSYIPIIGIFFFIINPRFFGGSFYNIKDILFVAWCFIACYFTLRWLEDQQGKKFLLASAFTIAVASNTRILGVAILLLAGGLVFLRDFSEKNNFEGVKQWLRLAIANFIFFVLITPFTWTNPIRNTLSMFFYFYSFTTWGGSHFFMGEMISRHVPWYYIPVWMGITLPILYIILFVIGITAFIYLIVHFFKQQIKSLIKTRVLEPLRNSSLHLYDVFFGTMFIFTLGGYIGLGISMYEGWRHAFILILPFLYITVYGLYKIYSFIKGKKYFLRVILALVVLASFVHTGTWMIRNHPYQYVFFNVIARPFAEENFALDYWNVSFHDLAVYLYERSNKQIIYLYAGINPFLPLILTEDQNLRIRMTGWENADYVLQCSRLAYDRRVIGPGPDFVQIHAITVDGMQIARLFQRVRPSMPVYQYE